MEEKENGGNREEVLPERIVLSNMYSMEALIDVLVEKGLVTMDEQEYDLIVPVDRRDLIHALISGTEKL